MPHSPSIYNLIRDPLRQSVEAASGGRNTVLYANGIPQIMVIFPRQELENLLGLGPGTHPAFIVRGQIQPEIFIHKFEATVFDSNKITSWPGLWGSGTAQQTWLSVFNLCRDMGPGWHLMTNAEWMLIAALCYRREFFPRGNTYYGIYDNALPPFREHECGTRPDGRKAGDTGGNETNLKGLTIPGSGPAEWYHDGSYFGCADLVGNLYEWVAGARIKNNQPHILSEDGTLNNDAADPLLDHTDASGNWYSFKNDGTLAAPESADTFFYSIFSNNSPYELEIAYTVNGNQTTPGWAKKFVDLGLGADVQAGPPVTMDAMQISGFYPINTVGLDDSAILTAGANGEQMLLRGGSRIDGHNGTVRPGMFAFRADQPRTNSTSHYYGYRAAYIPLGNRGIS